MNKVKITLASVPSYLLDLERNLEEVRESCRIAGGEGARLLLLPELMLTGHGGHPLMAENAEPVPDGPLAQEVIRLSEKYDLCVCVGIAENRRQIVYNSQMVADRGEYLGLQRKINLSNDESCHFAAGESVEVFDIGDLRFGITICYDNHFPELGLVHALDGVDAILAPHASRVGSFPYEPWPEKPSDEFLAEVIRERQDRWESIERARALETNAYVLCCNTVGSSTDGLEGVVANHAGTVMGVDPAGRVFLRTGVKALGSEIVTVELDPGRRLLNHGPTRNRRLATVIRLLRGRYAEGVK
jgi:predicted amidohydrolase